MAKNGAGMCIVLDVSTNLGIGHKHSTKVLQQFPRKDRHK